MKTYQQVIVALLIAACSGSLGYGYSQGRIETRIGSQVVAHEVLISSLKQEMNDQREGQRRAMDTVGRLFEKNMEAINSLITLIKEQQADIRARVKP